MSVRSLVRHEIVQFLIHLHHSSSIIMLLTPSFCFHPQLLFPLPASTALMCSTTFLMVTSPSSSVSILAYIAWRKASKIKRRNIFLLQTWNSEILGSMCPNIIHTWSYCFSVAIKKIFNQFRIQCLQYRVCVHYVSTKGCHWDCTK